MMILWLCEKSACCVIKWVWSGNESSERPFFDKKYRQESIQSTWKIMFTSENWSAFFCCGGYVSVVSSGQHNICLRVSRGLHYPIGIQIMISHGIKIPITSNFHPSFSSTPPGLQVEWACHEDGWFTWMVRCGILHRVWFGDIYGSSTSALNLVLREKRYVDISLFFFRRKGKEDEKIRWFQRWIRFEMSFFEFLKDGVVQCVQVRCIVVLYFVFSMCSDLPGFVWNLVYCLSKFRKESSLTCHFQVLKTDELKGNAI